MWPVERSVRPHSVPVLRPAAQLPFHTRGGRWGHVDNRGDRRAYMLRERAPQPVTHGKRLRFEVIEIGQERGY